MQGRCSGQALRGPGSTLQAPAAAGQRRCSGHAVVNGLPLSQHAHDTVGAFTTLFTLKLWRLITERRGCERTQFPEFQ